MEASKNETTDHGVEWISNPRNFKLRLRGMGMDVCCTLGMIEKRQAEELKKAGLTAYTHNLYTSREYYPNIISTRSYDERLETLKHVREAGINVCSGVSSVNDSEQQIAELEGILDSRIYTIKIKTGHKSVIPCIDEVGAMSGHVFGVSDHTRVIDSCFTQGCYGVSVARR